MTFFEIIFSRSLAVNLTALTDFNGITSPMSAGSDKNVLRDELNIQKGGQYVKGNRPPMITDGIKYIR